MKHLMILVPNLRGGGQERVAALTSVVLEKDYKIFFVVFNGSQQKYSISDKAEMFDIAVPEQSGLFHKSRNVLLRAKKVRSLKKKYGIDFTLSFGRTANLVNCLSKADDKVICSVRNSSNLETGERNWINTFIYRASDQITCISCGQMNKILKVYPSVKQKICVIYNPCDIEAIEKKSKEELGCIFPENTIVSCGRLEDVKCYKNLFHAVKRVKSEIEDFHLIVIGEGRREKDLKEYLQINGMEDFVTLTGFMENPFRIMRHCKAFVFSSSSEGYGNVIVEALACGVPVISTDCCYGPREMLSENMDYGLKDQYSVEEYGILTPPFREGEDAQEREEEIFAFVFREVLTNTELREALQAKGYAHSRKFSKDAYRERIRAMLEDNVG